MKPKISVVIPVYNGEKTLERCLNSVLDQNYPDFEIIIVDNGSIDRTYEIIHSYNNSKIRYFNEPIKGRGRARNLGIKKIEGKLIAMIDSDCVAPRNWLTELSKPILENDEKIVMGGEESVYQNYYSDHIQKANEKIIEKSREGKYIKHLDTKNIIFKKEVFVERRFDPEIKNCEDFEFLIQILNVYKIFYLPEVKVKHYHRINRKEWIKTQIDRAFETTKIYKKHSHLNLVMFESFSSLNWIKLSFWLFIQMIKKTKDFKFIFWTEISWRFGILLYYFDKVGLYKYE
jgi:glycosyltransferase involved in cell wall biosynthesis